MKCDWSDEQQCVVTIRVKDYPEQGVTLEDLKPLIHEIRTEAKDMIIHADLEGTGLLGINKLKMIASICHEVIEYTKHDTLLKRLEIRGAGPVFATLYVPIHIVLPKAFRDNIVLL